MAREHHYTITVGDKIQVTDGTRRWREGTIVKIGHKLVHVNEGGFGIVQYWRDGQGRRDGYPGHFRTLEQAEQVDGLAKLLVELRGLGLNVTPGSDWSVTELDALVQYAKMLQHARLLKQAGGK